MNYHFKGNPYFEARIYIGSRVKYNGPAFTFEELRKAIGEYQHSRGLEWANPVRITQTHYVWDDYDEPGWEVAIIDYPRRTKAHSVLRCAAMELAGYLLDHFKQNRISVVFPDEIVMLEADDAEDQHNPGEKRAATR